MTNLYIIQRGAIAALLALLVSSTALSLLASSWCIIKLPAGDVWQHVSLIEQAAASNITANDLFQKHNYLHFIPIPKLVYALDLMFFAGNGQLTAYTSIALTILCCLAFSLSIFNVANLAKTEKISLSLIMSSWLICILQWESFINPSNLQWSGMNAGLMIMALGWQRRFWWLAIGALLAIGCGAQWWILLTAFWIALMPKKYFLASACLIVFLSIMWELANTFFLQHYPPLPALLIQQATPFSSDQLASITESYFNNPATFYFNWLKNLLIFLTRFCMPPINQWLTVDTIIWLSPIPVLSLILLTNRTPAWRCFTFVATATFLTGLAAGIARSHLTYAYTSRFANIGLLFVCACFVLSYAICQQNIRKKYLWWLLAILYSLLLAISAYKEAGNIVQGSNHRRLSQIAYALDIHDVNVTSETPYAPLMELSYKETNERKVILANHQLGIYNSREHLIFSGKISLPDQEIHCIYSANLVTALKNDHAARRITGQAVSQDGYNMNSILIRDDRGTPLGYGISKIIGRTLAEQLVTPHQWTGLFHLPDNNLMKDNNTIEVIAYNQTQRCQTDTVSLSPNQ